MLEKVQAALARFFSLESEEEIHGTVCKHCGLETPSPIRLKFHLVNCEENLSLEGQRRKRQEERQRETQARDQRDASFRRFQSDLEAGLPLFLCHLSTGSYQVGASFEGETATGLWFRDASAPGSSRSEMPFDFPVPKEHFLRRTNVKFGRSYPVEAKADFTLEIFTLDFPPQASTWHVFLLQGREDTGLQVLRSEL